ncbi:MAG: serine/threonine-protein kinase, partial [Candidatus Zixiibacteriota bacterium]
VMVMELLEGETLETLLDELADDPPRALELMIRVIEAMSHVGERGLIHSDLKPSNVILHGDRIKIIDFGVATGATSLTAEDIKEIKGTLSYLSPEQADGRPLDIRSDIFSAGVMFYQMLTGKLRRLRVSTRNWALLSTGSFSGCWPRSQRSATQTSGKSARRWRP